MAEPIVVAVVGPVALALLWALVKWSRRAMRRDHEAAVLRVVEPRLAEIRAELRPNGGTSAVDRIDQQLSAIDGRVADVATLLAQHIDDHRRRAS